MKIIYLYTLFLCVLMTGLLAPFQRCQAAMDMKMEKHPPENMMVIDPARLQSIGITYEPVRSQRVEKIIRTVGHVEADERRIAHIHVKFEGWIEKLLVNFTGENVKKDQALFTVYSPELLATQQEVLLALN